jgi:hypothetical protein
MQQFSTPSDATHLFAGTDRSGAPFRQTYERVRMAIHTGALRTVGRAKRGWLLDGRGLSRLLGYMKEMWGMEPPKRADTIPKTARFRSPGALQYLCFVARTNSVSRRLAT